MLNAITILRRSKVLFGKIDVSNQSEMIFAGAVVLGLLLRLTAFLLGDIDPGGDGMWRLGYAIGWAQHPKWEGLSGVWPPVHWYFLGSLLLLWNEPILLAKTIGLVFGMGAIFAMRSAVRHLFGDLVAAVSALLLSIYWTHIWLTSSYWVEIPFIFLVLSSINYSMRSLERRSAKDVFTSSVFLSLALLLRHEGHLLLGLFIIWYILNNRSWRLVLTFAALPLCISAWMFIEPWINGHSYFEFISFVKSQKAGENLMQGVTLRDCLTQWTLMPATVPSIFVVIPGLYGLWKARHMLRRDLFGWLFIAQVSFYLSMTLTSAWRPQLRYILIYFINLLPYAAFVWIQMIQRFPVRYSLTALLTATILAQSSAWWVGRNNRYPLGWLPLRVPSSAQQSLDQWILKVSKERLSGIRLVSLAAGSRVESWSLAHAFLVNGLPSNLFNKNLSSPFKCEEVYVADLPGIHQGDLPASMYEADMVLVDSNASFYQAIIRSLTARRRNVKAINIHPHIAVILLSPDIQKEIVSN